MTPAPKKGQRSLQRHVEERDTAACKGGLKGDSSLSQPVLQPEPEPRLRVSKTESLEHLAWSGCTRTRPQHHLHPISWLFGSFKNPGKKKRGRESQRVTAGGGGGCEQQLGDPEKTIERHVQAQQAS